MFQVGRGHSLPFSFNYPLKETIMQENKEITDVEFTEVTKEEAAPIFNPVVFLTEALTAKGLTEAAAKWVQDIDPRAQSAESEKDRIFFANRALRLYLAEIEGRDNVTPRMLLADGIDSVKWIALMEQGIIPWLLGQFDKKGKRVTSEGDAVVETEAPVVVGMDVAAGEDQTVITPISDGAAGEGNSEDK